MTAEDFRTRSEIIDENLNAFLRLLVSLGGHCTVAQAEELKLAENERRTRAQLRKLERYGFLRRVAAYPVVYQVTKTTTRHLERDSGTRRRHSLETIQNRLLTADFYLTARKWPAQFILDHEQKIAAFTRNECPRNALPKRAGQPYLRDEFLLWLPNRRLGIARIDQPHRAAITQLLGLIRSFAPSLRYLGEGALELLIVTGSERRYYVYKRLLQHPKVQAAWPGEFEFAVRAHCVSRPIQMVSGLICPQCKRPKSGTDASHEDQSRQNRRRSKTNELLTEQHRSTQSIPSIHCDFRA